jgi:hypothetical protein
MLAPPERQNPLRAVRSAAGCQTAAGVPWQSKAVGAVRVSQAPAWVIAAEWKPGQTRFVSGFLSRNSKGWHQVPSPGTCIASSGVGVTEPSRRIFSPGQRENEVFAG